MEPYEILKTLREKRGLTQEQLAEALGVTVGAVHKWEAKLSTPELNLITELADFFDVSVAALLGYRMRNNSLKAVTDRLAYAISSEDPAGIAEAEKALKRFPHAFDIVYHSAVLYMIFGCKSREQDLLDRAYRLGIRAFWNFAQVDLKYPRDAIVVNVHLSDSLYTLGYRMNEKGKG